MAIRRPKSNKNPPIMSHEFVIQNHADIVSCVAMVFVVGLMFQISNPVASLFIALQHNITTNASGSLVESGVGGIGGGVITYLYGSKDVFTVFFYVLISVVIHAVVQEYALDKVNRKMHLSKVKHSKFNESGQLFFFYALSAGWGGDIIIRDSYLTNFSSLWTGYPHAEMSFISKFYFLIQIAYWLHSFPELYFQKVKKEEMAARVQYALLYLVFVTGAYMLNLTHVALCMLVLHYIVEMVFHVSRLLYFSEKEDVANIGFWLWGVMFVVVRLGTTTLAVLTFWYGMEKTGVASIDFQGGNFNTQIMRINCLAAVSLLQAWMMWNFITFQLQKRRGGVDAASSSAVRRTPLAVTKRRDRKAKAKRDSDDDVADGDSAAAAVPAENGSVRNRATKSAKQRH